MKNNIPAGYKDSAVGIIPQEWDVKRVKDLGSVITGSTPPTADVSNYGSEYMFVSPADLSDNQKYVLSTEKMLSSKGYAISRKMPKGTILYTCIGSTIGKIGIASRELTSNQQINAVICNDKTEYLYYALLFTTGRIKMLAGEQAVPIINKSEFENIKLAVPPMEEQRKIAEILGVWDEAIEKQSRLIEKLELRKRGLMQRLLTGRTRLLGFTSPWQKVKFKQIFEKKNITLGANNTALEVLSVTKEGIVSQKEYFNKDIASEDTSKYLLVEKGDLAMSGLNFWMGSCHILTKYDKGIISPAYKVFKVSKIYNLSFMIHFVQSHTFKYSLVGCSVIGASIVRRNLDKEMLDEWCYLIPSLPEQKAIAEVLTVADKEIATHRKKLDVLRLQKRGLMQQLLTGKTRVKI